MPCKGKGLMVPNTSQQHTADLSEHVPGMGKSNNVHKTVLFWLEFISSTLTTYKQSFTFKM